jgi:hypothetical protein
MRFGSIWQPFLDPHPGLGKISRNVISSKIYGNTTPNYSSNSAILKPMRNKACSWVYFYYDLVCCSGVRPFGVSLLIAGYDDNGPQLYQVWTERYKIEFSGHFTLLNK